MASSYWKSISNLEKKGRDKREERREREKNAYMQNACRNTILLACSLQNSSPHDRKLSSEDIRYSRNSQFFIKSRVLTVNIYTCMCIYIYTRHFPDLPPHDLRNLFEVSEPIFQGMGILSMDGISHEGLLLPCDTDYHSCSDEHNIDQMSLEV